MKTLTITLPLPHRALSPNGREHWRTVAKHKRRMKDSAWAQAMRQAGADWPLWTRATAQATFYHVVKRTRDGDNALASLKAAFDGIAEAGVVANDSMIAHQPVQFAIDKKNPRVEITVTGEQEDV